VASRLTLQTLEKHSIIGFNQVMSGKNYFGLHKNVFFSGVVSLFMDISSEMVYPLVPLFLTDVLNTTRTAVGIIEGVAESTASILKVFSGWLSDVLGRRKLLMSIGYGVSVISRPIIAGAGSWPEVLTARFIDRVGKGVRTAPRDAIIADSTMGLSLGRAFGLHRAMDTVGAIIGPALAAMLLAVFLLDLRLVFLLSAIPGTIAVALIVFFIKEKKRTRQGLSKAPKLSLTSFDGPFRHYILVTAIFSLGSVSDAFIILRAADLGIQKELIPIIYLLFNIIYAASSMPFGMVADRVGLKKMVVMGLLLYAAIFAGFAAARGVLDMWLLFSLYGIYKGMSDGAQKAYLAELAGPEVRGTAFGVFHTAAGLMLLPASIIGGVLWDSIGPEATFLYASSLSLLSVLVFVLPGSTKKPS
jgi:MFS family permease